MCVVTLRVRLLYADDRSDMLKKQWLAWFGAEGLREGKAGTLISCGSVRFVRIYHSI